jgi:phthalate 4,5-cis-dihydrodiol dehydrogenase
MTTERKMKVGVAGLGAGAVAVVRAMELAPFLDLVAAADVRPQALDAFKERYHGRTYDSVEGLCADPDVEAIWISTPNHLHSEHAITAANHGKHMVVEKPMAISLQQAEQMVEAAEKNNVKMLCGHTASLMAANRAMRRVVASGEFGPLHAVNVWSYTDWMLRPRMPAELDLAQGGGVPFRQGPHQVDTIRLLGGGMVRSVRAMTGQWMPNRPAPGYYAAYIEFEDGTPATIVHNGYGRFSTFEFVPWVGVDVGKRQAEAVQTRQALAGGGRDDAADKNDRRFGGATERRQYAQAGVEGGAGGMGMGFQGDLGIVIASCEGADIRQSPHGLWVYDDNGQRELPVEGLREERFAELDEMYQAVTQNRPVAHDGRWGMATLEVVLGIMQSGRERREIMMSHQCPSYE